MISATGAQCHPNGLSAPKNPAGMNSIVMKPQAMKAAMFGMIMPERNVPSRCTPTRTPFCFGAAVDVVVMMSSLSGVKGGP